ncbi:MAG TPA: methyltransferase [Polyangiaceae bacterium]|jgi:trans-aconitate methyltransferase|nr:methyltransferase [Polyangiaceae bacterium]
MTPDEQTNPFDEVAHDYVGDLNRNLRLAGGDSRFFYQAKLRLIRSRGVERPRIVLDFGCGVGILTRMLADAYPEAMIVGFDPSAEEIRVARAEAAAYGQRLQFASHFDAETIRADVAVAAGVLHHIPPANKQPSLARLFDALAPGGRLFVFEHNPISPLTRIIVAMAKVDRGATLMSARAMKRMVESAGFVEAETSYISFFPAFLKVLVGLEHHLRAIPLSAQYMLTARKP